MFSSVFERGMKCFDSYSARCLQNRKLNLFKNNVEGARKFFNKFCSDEDFQRGEREKYNLYGFQFHSIGFSCMENECAVRIM